MIRIILGCLLLAWQAIGAEVGRVDGFAADWAGIEFRLRELATNSMWSIELSKLPITLQDCENQERCSLAFDCHGLCVRRPQLAGVEVKRRRLYFTVDAGTSRNPPSILFEYDLSTRRARRLSTDFGAGLTVLKLSPDGRYLAYAMLWHLGLSCPPLSSASIVDLRTGKRAPLGGWIPKGAEQRQSVEVTGLEWVKPSRLRAEATIRDAECGEAVAARLPEGEKKRQTVNPGALRYR